MKIQAKVEATIEEITPAEAKAFLANPWPGQRGLREHPIEGLVREMKAGNWKISPDCITIIKGYLANGQHRLTAVVESGMPQIFVILRSDDEELYKVIDCGMKRTTGDVIGCKNANTVAAGANWVLSYDKGMISIFQRRSVSRLEVIEYAQGHAEELMAHAEIARSLNSHQRILSPAMMVAFLMIGSRFDPVECKTFLEYVMKGTGSSLQARVLRDRLIKERISKQRLADGTIFAYLIKAYRAYYEDREINTLRFSEGEAYPQFPG